jgi:DNA-binding transcriptional LysR family regulator
VNLEQLEAVVAVVDYGSYAAAADGLRISQPSLTRRIQRCEAELGLALFTRVGRRMQVTDAGRSVLGPARRMLQEANGLRALADAQHALTVGTLRIGALPSLVATHVPELVARFHAAHPDVRIEVTGAVDSAELLEAIDLGRIDLGVADVAAVGPGVEVTTARTRPPPTSCGSPSPRSRDASNAARPNTPRRPSPARSWLRTPS